MSRNQPRRGEICLVDWSPGRGSEQLGQQPALVVQTDAANSNPRYPNAIVIAISTKGLRVATHVDLLPDAGNGLRAPSWAKFEQLLTISKDRLLSKWGNVSRGDLERIEKALMTALGM